MVQVGSFCPPDRRGGSMCAELCQTACARGPQNELHGGLEATDRCEASQIYPRI